MSTTVLCPQSECGREDLTAKVDAVVAVHRGSTKAWQSFVTCSKGHLTMISGGPAVVDPGPRPFPSVEVREPDARFPSVQLDGPERDG